MRVIGCEGEDGGMRVIGCEGEDGGMRVIGKGLGGGTCESDGIVEQGGGSARLKGRCTRSSASYGG
jgi:hypothetical protein